MNQSDTQLKYSEITEPVYSCEFLLTYLAKEIAKEYVKNLENNQSDEPKYNLKGKE